MKRIFATLIGVGQSGTDSKVSRYPLEQKDLVWVVGSFCALNRKPFDPQLLIQQFPPPYTTDTLVGAVRATGLRIKQLNHPVDRVEGLSLPCLVMLKDASELGTVRPLQESSADNESTAVRPAIVVQSGPDNVVIFPAGSNSPLTLSKVDFAARFTDAVFLVAMNAAKATDPDAATANARFGFRWFVPELLKYRRVWREVIGASLIIQLLALATPLFTQVVIDKVVVHRTQSTLIVIGIGLLVFMVFSSLLTWVRQYLVLHTGNRVDAVLGAAVFEHLFKLPPRYFEQRPTGVISARLKGVENIREFVSSAAVTLVLDLPFLLIFLGIMFSYSMLLTAMVLALIGCIVLMTLFVAPIFRARMNDQFLLAARNQAFTTEYIAGLETVKSLQMEPQLQARYGDYLAEYLRSGFLVRQIANTYNVIAGGIDQMVSLLILVLGAYLVMNGNDFTIGMLVAFQMFASRVSQPMLRLVGLWQQFQQASLSVARLGDIMDIPAEPYSALPQRTHRPVGSIEIDRLSFRYGESLPLLYENFNLSVQPGKIVAIMGPSGSGKSTLSKLLQGFYLPTTGMIKIDGRDIRYLAANELRLHFGIVPQETVLFSGTIYENLLMANPLATFEQIVDACRAAEIHEVIEALPNGYQNEIGERGAGLSGGQKQRIAIARAVLRNPKILIFDEATSSLDPQTAEHFSATVNQLKGRVTMLFITHALPKSLLVDDIVHIGSLSGSSKHAQRSSVTRPVDVLHG